MFGLNLSALLDSLDNVAKETLEEPKESATEIRSKRKASSKVDIIAAESSSHDNTSTFDQGNDDSGNFESVEKPPSIPVKGTLDESSTHSYKTQESYVIPSLSTHGSQHGSLDDGPGRDRINSVSSLTKAAPIMTTAPSPLQQLLPRLPSMPNIINQAPPPPPPHANPAMEQQGVEIAELKKEVRRQDKEIESLNQECLELEEAAATLRQEVAAAWDQHRLAAERVNQLQGELEEEQRMAAMTIKKERMTAAQQLAMLEGKLEEQANLLRMSEKSRQLLEEEKASFTSVISDHQAIVHSLEGELKASREAGIQLAVRHREELRQVTLAMDRLRAEHGEVIKANRQRQLQLEQEVNDLTQSLATTAASNNNSSSSANSSSSSETNRLRLEHDQLVKESLSLQQQLSKLAAAFEQEKGLKTQTEGRLRQALAMSEMDKGRLSSLESELKAARDQILSLSQSLQQQEQSTSSNSRSNTDNSHGFELLDQLSQDLNPANNTTSSNSSLKQQQQQQQQLDQVSKLLLKKQSELQEAILERSSLRARVSELTGRCSLQEQRISSLEEQVDMSSLGMGMGMGMDMMAGGGDLEEGDASHPTSAAAAARRRGGGGSLHSSSSVSQPPTPSKSKMVTDLEKMGLRPPGSVSRTISLLDSFSLMAGRIFRLYPIARLGFVLYLLVLHLWVIFILVLHMHDLELPDGPQDHIIIAAWGG